MSLSLSSSSQDLQMIQYVRALHHSTLLLFSISLLARVTNRSQIFQIYCKADHTPARVCGQSSLTGVCRASRTPPTVQRGDHCQWLTERKLVSLGNDVAESQISAVIITRKKRKKPESYVPPLWTRLWTKGQVIRVYIKLNQRFS